MILTCPACRARYSLDASGDADQMRFAENYRRIPTGRGLGDLVKRYLALFRPEKKALSWSSAANRITEVADLMAAGTVQSGNKPARPCPPEAWAEALGRMLDRPPRSLPIKNHNYLKVILYEIADEQDRKTEYARNQRERSGEWRDDRKIADADRIDFDEMRRITDERFRKRTARRNPAGDSAPVDAAGQVPAGSGPADHGADAIRRGPAAGSGSGESVPHISEALSGFRSRKHAAGAGEENPLPGHPPKRGGGEGVSG